MCLLCVLCFFIVLFSELAVYFPACVFFVISTYRKNEKVGRSLMEHAARHCINLTALIMIITDTYLRVFVQAGAVIILSM